MAGWGCGACGETNVPGTRFCGYCGVRRAERSEVSDAELAAALEGIPTSVAATRVEQGADAEERRVVTSLFADVSGFTTLADRLEPDELHEIIAPVIAGLAAVGDKYEGFIAKYAGDALLIFFGAPIAHEDDATRAVLTALEMHETLPRLTAALPPDAQGLSMHIGINTGRVISGRYGGESRSDYSILGDAVILAQRLESVAGSGETYVGPSTYELTKDEFRYESLGELQLKGKLRPVQAYKLLGRRHSVAISGAPLDRPRTPLVGRDDELGAVWRLLDRLAAGQGGMVAVAGEPGVGKSRLLREVREQAGEAGVRWYQGRCVSYGAGTAYHPFTDLLRQVSGIRPEDPPERSAERLDAVLGAAADARPFIASLLGLPAGDALSDLTPEGFRRGLHAGIKSWIRSLASQAPVVLALEDLHWADSASLALLSELHQLTADAPVLAYLTARPEGWEQLEAMVAPAAPHALALRLAPLGAAAMRQLLAVLLDATPPIELVSIVTERAAGNPLFVEELVRTLKESGDLEQRAGRWRLRPGWDERTLPTSIESVLSSRLDRLPPAEAQVLQLASVVGRVVPVTLAELLLTEIEAGVDALDALVGRGLLDRTIFVGEPAVMFSHALVHDVAYNRLMKRTRRDLHRRVATVLEERFGDAEGWLDYLARQLYLGEVGEKAADYLCRAGERAKRLYANDAAIEHYRHALDVERQAAHGRRRAEVTLALAELEELVGHHDAALELYSSLKDADAAEAWCGAARVLRRTGAYAEALATLEDALSTPTWSASQRAGLLLERGALLMASSPTEAAVTLQSGLELLDGSDDALASRLLLMLARVEESLGRLEDAIGHATQALQGFERDEDVRGTASALRQLGGHHANAGHPDDAASCLQRALELAERTGTAEEIGAALLNLGRALELRGDVADAIACDRRAIEVFDELGHPNGRATAWINLAEALLLAGDVPAAVEAGQSGVQVAREIGNELVLAEALDTLGTGLRRAGDADASLACAQESVERLLALGLREAALARIEATSAAFDEAGATAQARALRALAHPVRAID